MRESRRCFRRALGAMVALQLACAGAWAAFPLPALADEAGDDSFEVIALQAEANAPTSGEWGSNQWWIDSGTLYFQYNESIDKSGRNDTSRGWEASRQNIRSVEFVRNGKSVVPPTKDLSGLFKGYSRLESFYGYGLDVSGVTNMSEMFDHCTSMTYCDVDGFDVRNLQNAAGMFGSCTKLDHVDLSGWNTYSLTNMSGMFSNCSGLYGVNWPSWNSSKVTNMSRLFEYCTSMTDVDFNSWDMSAVSDMSSMFRGCSNLTGVGVNNWNTSSARDMSHMFDGCSALRYLDISGWKTSRSATAMTDMFKNVTLNRFTVGSGYGFAAAGVPTSAASDGRWWSNGATAWLTNSDIYSKRQNMADTYSSSANTMRLSGATRYDTMSSIVSAGFGNNNEWAVVTTGENYPDALSASALAGVYDCPVILTTAKELSKQASYQLGRLSNVRHVIIIGGTGTVSNGVKNEIEGMGKSVERISGTDRYDTSAKVLARVRKGLNDKKLSSDTILVATGSSYADALSVGPWSYYRHYPIVLAGTDGKLPASVVKAVNADTKIKRVVFIGGDAAVSDQIKTQLGGSYAYSRLGGADRYATSKAIAEYTTSNGLGWGSPAVATGKNFPDALAGAALCGIKGSPLLLADSPNESTVTLLKNRVGRGSKPYILGGTAAVGADVEKSISDKMASL